MDLIPVEGNPGLYRDSLSNAIVNTNKNDYESYVRSREKINSGKHQVESLQKQVSDLKDDIDEIKQLLKETLRSKS